MVNDNVSTCPNCNGDLIYYDKVNRILRTKRRVSDYVELRRLRCINCGAIHRELPKNIFPYKQYEAELINGVLESFITSEILGYEDYPCETTMSRWKTQKIQILLWKR